MNAIDRAHTLVSLKSSKTRLGRKRRFVFLGVTAAENTFLSFSCVHSFLAKQLWICVYPPPPKNLTIVVAVHVSVHLSALLSSAENCAMKNPGQVKKMVCVCVS